VDATRSGGHGAGGDAVSMDSRFRNVECSLCRRRFPQSRCTPGELNRRKAWYCPYCVAPINAGETTAAGVRAVSERRGRKQ
jgi:hypothetical protein